MKTTSIKFTRSDYMAKKCSHRDYFAQFVGPYVRDLVASRIGVDRLCASRDPNLNDIPLSVWDSFWVKRVDGGLCIRPPLSISERLKEAGEDNSASTGTCILKEAARQVIDLAKVGQS